MGCGIWTTQTDYTLYKNIHQIYSLSVIEYDHSLFKTTYDTRGKTTKNTKFTLSIGRDNPEQRA